MIRKKRHLIAASVMTLSAWGVASFAMPAIADEPLSPVSASPDDVSALVAEAAHSAGVNAADSSADSSVGVVVPKDASDGITVGVADALDFTVATPVGVSVDDGVTASDGSTVYSGDEGEPDVTVMPLASGVRVSTVVWDESQATNFGYPLPEGVDGNAIPSTYAVVDGILTQEVDTTDAVFPVVADPTWKFTSAIQIRARWNRAETATIAGGGWGSAGMTAICGPAGYAVAGPAGAAAFSAGCFATSAPAIYTAGVAQNSKPKRCLEGFLTYVPGVSLIVPWYGTYACR